MTTDEAKKYCIEVIGMSENDFQIASEEDVEYGYAEKDEWVHEYLCYIAEGPAEGEMKTAIQLAEEHKFWSDPKNVDAYVDFMLEENQ